MTTHSEIRAINKDAKGSTKTRIAREYVLKQAAAELRLRHNVQIRTFADLKTNHLQKLVDSWAKAGLSQRTAANRLAHIRAALRSAGRDKFAVSQANSNRELWKAANGLPDAVSASRKGTHKPPAQEVIAARIAGLVEPFRTVASLQKTLGLRQREAVEAGKSLRTWEKQLQAGAPLTVLFGTKGGRSRNVRLIATEHRREALHLVQHAIGVMGKEDHLIPANGKSPAEAAIRAYQRAMNFVGFKGSEASHAIRYAWARQQFAAHLRELGDKKIALAALSLDLGHGDGRGRYCNQVYLQNTTE